MPLKKKLQEGRGRAEKKNEQFGRELPPPSSRSRTRTRTAVEQSIQGKSSGGAPEITRCRYPPIYLDFPPTKTATEKEKCGTRIKLIRIRSQMGLLLTAPPTTTRPKYDDHLVIMFWTRFHKDIPKKFRESFQL